jgi:uncharacterized BrkB/YihY/UPF0761 family membrane protein
MANISTIGEGSLIQWGETSLEGLIQGRGADLLNTFVGLSALVAVILIVVAGYTFITSAGDAEKVEKAQKTLTAAIVGMIIVFLARVIVGFVLEDILKAGSDIDPLRPDDRGMQEE